ncbi:MAG: HEAT repeat domain-containing protein [Phycisphaerae bacterium]|nr:HEAT repeat domain-containing protein [Phycisphaerae bacterium]
MNTNRLILLLLIGLLAAGAVANGASVKQSQGSGENVKAPAALEPFIERMVAKLSSKDPVDRRYSAVILSELIGEIKDPGKLKSWLGRITSAATKDVDKEVRQYAGQAMRDVQDMLKKQGPSAEPARDKPAPKSGKPPAARRDANKQPKKVENWRVLIARLKDSKPEVREQAAAALREALRQVKNQAELKQVIPPLTAAAMNDSSTKVRQAARMALRDVMSRVDDQAVLASVTRRYLTGLKHSDPKVRAHYAHDLSRVVSKIEDKATLARLAGPLTAATLESTSMDAPDFPGFAQRNVLRRIKDQKVLIPVVHILVGGLTHKDQTIRGFCTHGLSECLRKIKDGAILKSMIQPLNTATDKASSMKARDFAGFALRSVLRKTDDREAIIPVIHSSIAGLEHKNKTMRIFYAHTLHENAVKVKDKALLARMVSPLTAASLRAEDSETKGLGASGLAYSALKQVLDKVDDQAALTSIIGPMAKALKARDIKSRRYAAHAVMLFAHKVKDKEALAPLRQPLVAMHSNDPDKNARESAGRALKRAFRQAPKPKSP